MCHGTHSAPLAQLDRAPDYESGGQEFESLRARHFTSDIRLAASLVYASGDCAGEAAGGEFADAGDREGALVWTIDLRG